MTKLRAMRLNKAGQLVETGVEETLAYYQVPGGSLAAGEDE